MNKQIRRLLAVGLAFCMIVTGSPANVAAQEESSVITVENMEDSVNIEIHTEEDESGTYIDEAVSVEESMDNDISDQDQTTPDQGVVYDFELKDYQVQIKEDVRSHNITDTVSSMEEGIDYVRDRVYCLVEDEDQAMLAAMAYGGTLDSYELGVAVIDLSDSGLTVSDAVELGARADNNLPAVEPDYIVTLDDPESDDGIEVIDDLGADPAGAAWEKAFYGNNIIEGGLGLNDPALNPLSDNYQWMHDMVHTYDAWTVTRGSSDITVAVIDSGVYQGHEEFKGRLSTYDVTGDGGKNGHGTHVAGIVAAAAGNGKGGAGIAPGVRLLCVNVFGGKDEKGEAVTTEHYSSSNLIKGIEYVIQGKKAQIINMSLGGDTYAAAEKAVIEKAYESGITVVISAGNSSSNSLHYPASFDMDKKGQNHIIVVGSVNQSSERSDFSSFGNQIDISAPGSDIYSTYNESSSSYTILDGTSMATPIVSGACALYMSANGVKSPDEMAALLKKSVSKCGSPQMGAGIIDLAKLMGVTAGSAKGTARSSESGNAVSTAKATVITLDTAETGVNYNIQKNKKGILTSVQLYNVNIAGTDGVNERKITINANVFAGSEDISNSVKLNWTTSNDKAVSISANGNKAILLATGKGKANITCQVQDGSKKKAVIKVNVITPASDISVVPRNKNGYSNVLGYGKSLQLKAVSGTAYGIPDNKKVLWNYAPILVMYVYNKTTDSVERKTVDLADGDSIKLSKKIKLGNGKLSIPREHIIQGLYGSDYDLYNRYSKDYTGNLELNGVYPGVRVTATAADGSGASGSYEVDFTQPAKKLAMYTEYTTNWNPIPKRDKISTINWIYEPEYTYLMDICCVREYYNSYDHEYYTYEFDSPGGGATVVSSNPAIASAYCEFSPMGAVLVMIPHKNGTVTFTVYSNDGSGVKGKVKVKFKAR